MTHSLHEDLAAVIMACEVQGLINSGNRFGGQRIIIEALQMYRQKTYDYIHHYKLSEQEAEDTAFRDVNNYLIGLKNLEKRREEDNRMKRYI